MRSRISDAERRVFERYARGSSSSEVAAELGLDVRDVYGHLRSVLDALRARSKLEALVILIRDGEL